MTETRPSQLKGALAATAAMIFAAPAAVAVDKTPSSVTGKTRAEVAACLAPMYLSVDEFYPFEPAYLNSVQARFHLEGKKLPEDITSCVGDFFETAMGARRANRLFSLAQALPSQDSSHTSLLSRSFWETGNIRDLNVYLEDPALDAVDILRMTATEYYTLLDQQLETFPPVSSPVFGQTP